MTQRFLVIALCAACGDSGGGASGDDAPPVDAALPEATCTAPGLTDTSVPTTVVGDGTPGSCTQTALQSAVNGGGIVTFNCGSAPTTIMLASQITVTKETVIDGNSLITLDGNNATRILYLDSGYDQTTPRLTVQRLSFMNGKSTRMSEDTDGGGAAIYRDGGSLTVMNSYFANNHGPATGQDLAGGAIYGFGGGETVIVGSAFIGNSASDGGAVGSLNGDLTIINSTFDGNQATGLDGNPGNGGCGGAIYMDGLDEAASLCGVTIKNSTAGQIGGAVFRVSNIQDGAAIVGSFAMDRTTIDNNRVTATGKGNAGGLYLEDLAITITASTISRNQAFYNGGIWLNGGAIEITNTTIAENTATGSNGGGVWLGNDPMGTMKNVTIANNRSTANGQVAGGIFGSGLTLLNTIVANNMAMYTPTCDEQRTDGSGNLQWPMGSLCTTSPLIADPMLAALGDNGGDTETLAPAAGSPARGIGTGCPAMDQRGMPRGEPCTAGAVEVP